MFTTYLMYILVKLRTGMTGKIQANTKTDVTANKSQTNTYRKLNCR